MINNQVAAFVSSFADLWQRESEAIDLVQQSKLRWWNHIFGFIAWVVFAVALHLIMRTDDVVAGWILMSWPQTWLALRIMRSMKAKVALQELAHTHSLDLMLRFQWRAFGLMEHQLHELKRMWGAERGIDYDAQDYRSWFAGATEQIRGAS